MSSKASKYSVTVSGLKREVNMDVSREPTSSDTIEMFTYDLLRNKGAWISISMGDWIVVRDKVDDLLGLGRERH
jgi:hypothetical protein